MSSAARVLAPDWYASHLGAPFLGIESTIAARCPRLVRGAAAKLRPVRGLAIFLLARHCARIALIKGDPGTATFLALDALRGRRRAVVLEFLPRPRPRAAPGRLAHHFAVALEGAMLRRAMVVGQVLTAGERERYLARYRLDPERLAHVPWALRRNDAALPGFDPDSRMVLSSGRGGCDWETLFAAAKGAPWPLTVICAERELKRVRELGRTTDAQILSDVSRREHDRRLRQAAAYVISLEDRDPAAGHVRLMAAVGAGVPVVATDARALEGYVDEDETAILVPPRSPERLRRAIDELIASPQTRRRLREAAWAAAEGRTYREYFEAIRRLVVDG